MPTNATAAAKIVELKPGDPVPFSGNLVPPITFKTMMIDIGEKDLLEEELELCRKARDREVEEKDNTFLVVSSIAGGFLLGAVLGRYLKFP